MKLQRLALLLALAAHSCALLGQTENKRAGTENRPSTTEQPPESAAGVSETLAIQAILERIARANEAQTAAEKSQAEQQREADDLVAQEEMAKWAKYMLLVTAVGLVVNFLAFGVLIWTLSATRKSAKAARRMAKIAKDTAERDLRAYLWRTVGEKVVSDFDQGFPQSVLSILNNGGKTPAKGVHQWSTFQALPDTLPDDFVFEEPPAVVVGPRFVVNPGAGPSFLTTISPLSDQARAELVQGRWRLYLWGVMRYADVFGDAHETRFRMKLRLFGDHGRREGVWTYCDEGNEAT